MSEAWPSTGAFVACNKSLEFAQSLAFTQGVQFLHAGYYWEAHEVLEPVWLALPKQSIEQTFVQGLIQLANGHLKLRMGRPKAALRLVGRARALVPSNVSLTLMTLNVGEVQGWVDALEQDIFLAL